MALLHQATINPTKRELLDGWLPSRSWFDGEVERGPVGSFRFDDPDGQVGMEGFLLGSGGGTTLFVPLTYRPAPLDGGEEHLVGTTEHSVLGTRWVYDACGDPVFAQALATAILTGGTEAVEELEVDGVRQRREPSVTVRGSGSTDSEVPVIERAGCRDEGAVTVVDAGPLELVVVRHVGIEVEAAQVLRASWVGGDGLALAGVRPA